MHPALLCGSFALIFVVPPRGQEPAAASRPAESRITIAGVGLKTPESALWDPQDDVYYVSNIHGHPTAEDDNGFVAKLSVTGKVLELEWISGASPAITLHAPKGMALVGDELWVADIQVVRVFAKKTRQTLRTIEIPGASFLNDLCATPDGEVYVSDTGLNAQFGDSGTDAIYRIGKDFKPQLVVRAAGLKPNGLCVSGGTCAAVTWEGGKLHLGFGKADAATVVTLPKGQLDGLERASDGSWWITSWGGSCVYRVRGSGKEAKVEVLLADLPQPADLGYDRKRDRLLVPLFGTDTLVIAGLPK